MTYRETRLSENSSFTSFNGNLRISTVIKNNFSPTISGSPWWWSDSGALESRLECDQVPPSGTESDAPCGGPFSLGEKIRISRINSDIGAKNSLREFLPAPFRPLTPASEMDSGWATDQVFHAAQRLIC